jgi:hypothetical protein
MAAYSTCLLGMCDLCLLYSCASLRSDSTACPSGRAVRLMVYLRIILHPRGVLRGEGSCLPCKQSGMRERQWRLPQKTLRGETVLYTAQFYDSRI